MQHPNLDISSLDPRILWENTDNAANLSDLANLFSVYSIILRFIFIVPYLIKYSIGEARSAFEK